MKDMKDISASAQEALEHARDKAFGKVKPGILEPLKSVSVSPIMAWYFEKQKSPKKQKVSVLNDAAGAIEKKFNEIQNGLDAIGEAMKPFLEVTNVPYVSICFDLTDGYSALNHGPWFII